MTTLNPYISFRDNARQAMEFYQTVFGGDLTLNTFAENHASDDPDEQNLIMHGQLESPQGLILMGADTPKAMSHNPGDNISVSLSGNDDAELTGYWEKLVDGGSVTVPLEMAPWGDKFGMCVDKFGINWLVNISGSAA